MRNELLPVVAGMLGALIMWVALQAFGPGGDVIVLHRAGNPPSMYIVKFDALPLESNLMSCEEFRGFVEKLSPETGPVKCSLLD